MIFDIIWKFNLLWEVQRIARKSCKFLSYVNLNYYSCDSRNLQEYMILELIDYIVKPNFTWKIPQHGTTCFWKYTIHFPSYWSNIVLNHCIIESFFAICQDRHKYVLEIFLYWGMHILVGLYYFFANYNRKLNYCNKRKKFI